MNKPFIEIDAEHFPRAELVLERYAELTPRNGRYTVELLERRRAFEQALLAITLRRWHERFLAQLHAVRELGYSDRFIRMWRWYLAYCEGGFMERAIGDVQMLFAKPESRRSQYLPDLKPSV